MTKQHPDVGAMVDPLDIYQTMLDFVSDAVLRGDVEQYLSAIALPYTIHTEAKRFDLTGADDLRATLICVSGGFRRQGITDYLRLSREARYVTRRRIEGIHYTHIMRGIERIAPPYAASQTLVFDGSVWRFCEARYAILNDALPIVFPEAGRNPDRLPFHPSEASRPG
ncbi:MAG: hypothetical protein H6897_08715 [Rhodobacteraceae bacterium]|jgi:hypothetical protein|uniref:hypothetical protein n=1 Tax=Albidovulum sp. TaxID=1872424 RepID=UPI001DB0C12B|nr:hypothetical protein [uncultured Defluviimonas sp.]MCB2127445.1 hypothetical protein [Paracoccaceae bacterium]MCC0069995.1 hypothetical protein [Paracoccaceae bacterium]